MRPPDFSVLMDGGFKALYMDIPFPTSISVTGYVWMVYYSRYGDSRVLLSRALSSCGGDRTAIRYVSSLLSPLSSRVIRSHPTVSADYCRFISLIVCSNDDLSMYTKKHNS